MVQMSVAQKIHAEQTSEQIEGKNQGTLKAGGKEHSVFPFTDSEAVTEGVSRFLQEANLQQELPETLQQHEFIPITPELIDIEQEIFEMHQELSQKSEDVSQEKHLNPPAKELQLHEKKTDSALTKLRERPKTPTEANPRSEKSEVYSSLFSLARSFHSNQQQNVRKEKTQKTPQEQTQKRDDGRHNSLILNPSLSDKINTPQRNLFDRDGEREQERDGEDHEEEGQGSFSDSDDPNQRQKEKKKQVSTQEKGGISVKKVEGKSLFDLQSTSSEAKNPQSIANPKISSPKSVLKAGQSEGGSDKSARESLGSVENIYIRFMALMARILGQAELEAHQLYLRIKERTDNVDALTLLLSKINSEKGAVDWSNNEEMKQLIAKAREIGVDIPEGKLSWSEEEKKLLKENIQMRKDSMEKMTQLERTDMQRYLQEASQCHQARSNVLKLLKEVNDTIIHNMRGG